MELTENKKLIPQKVGEKQKKGNIFIINEALSVALRFATSRFWILIQTHKQLSNYEFRHQIWAKPKKLEEVR